MKNVLDQLREEARHRINAVIRSAQYLQSKKKITTPEARAFLVGLEHAREVIDTLDVKGIRVNRRPDRQ